MRAIQLKLDDELETVVDAVFETIKVKHTEALSAAASAYEQALVKAQSVGGGTNHEAAVAAWDALEAVRSKGNYINMSNLVRVLVARGLGTEPSAEDLMTDMTTGPARGRPATR